jgi:hypothetical protein
MGMAPAVVIRRHPPLGFRLPAGKWRLNLLINFSNAAAS